VGFEENAMSRLAFRRWVATLALLLVAAALPVRAGGASLSGRVFGDDARTPRAGVVVALVTGDTERVIRSGATSEDGAFAIADADPGTYTLLIEAEQGAFLSPDPLVLASGANRPLALSMQTTATTGFGAGQGAGLSLRTKWIIAGAISATALFLVLESGDDVEEDASPF
jgi:hypothetical protein